MGVASLSSFFLACSRPDWLIVGWARMRIGGESCKNKGSLGREDFPPALQQIRKNRARSSNAVVCVITTAFSRRADKSHSPTAYPFQLFLLLFFPFSYLRRFSFLSCGDVAGERGHLVARGQGEPHPRGDTALQEQEAEERRWVSSRLVHRPDGHNHVDDHDDHDGSQGGCNHRICFLLLSVLWSSVGFDAYFDAYFVVPAQEMMSGWSLARLMCVPDLPGVPFAKTKRERRIRALLNRQAASLVLTVCCS